LEENMRLLSRSSYPAASVLTILCSFVAHAACGGSETGRAGPAKTGGSGVVALSKIESCAGFTPDVVAAVMAVPASEITATTERIHDTSLACGFANPAGSTVLSFSLSWEKTVEESVEALATEKENLGLAQRTIGGVTGNKQEEPAVAIIEGIGDEAFWTPVNDTVVVRVGNVRIQVMLPDDREKQKETARRVASGLR
jgi:hypothetical protein